MRRIDDGLSNQERYALRLRAAGRCPNCGKSPEDKLIYCRRCRQHKYELRRKLRARKRAARPIAYCDHCGKPRGDRPKYCVACAMDTSLHRRELAKRGLCWCHKPLAPGKSRCAKCLAKNTAAVRAKAEVRKAARQCQRCGRRAKPGYSHCAHHLEAARVEYWTERGLTAPPRREKPKRPQWRRSSRVK